MYKYSFKITLQHFRKKKSFNNIMENIIRKCIVNTHTVVVTCSRNTCVVALIPLRRKTNLKISTGFWMAIFIYLEIIDEILLSLYAYLIHIYMLIPCKSVKIDQIHVNILGNFGWNCDGRLCRVIYKARPPWHIKMF